MSPHERPHFLGIGAQKSATSWLDRCLRAHPGLWLPPIKELHYFSHRAEDAHPGVAGRLLGNDWVNHRLRGIIRRRLLADVRYLDPNGLRWDMRFFFGSRNDAWYASLFERGSGRVTGEITPEYASLSAGEVGRIHAEFPQLRLVFLMRDPIDRDWSQMRMIAERAGRSLSAVSEAAWIELARDPRVSARGVYRTTLENWGLHFAAARFFVGFVEDVRSNPRDLLLDLFRFLGVEARDSFLPPDLMRPVHTGRVHPIPGRVERELAVIHLDDIRLLEERFGPPVTGWLQRAERALEL